MKKSFNKLLVLLNTLFVLTYFCSCGDVQYTAPQPSWVTKNETAFPKSMQGNYKSGNDTFKITEDRIMLSKKDFDNDIVLSDSVLLRKWNTTFFLNLLHRNYSGSNSIGNGSSNTWSVIMAKEEKENLFIYEVRLTDSLTLIKLKEITKVQEIKNTSGEINDFIINPTADEFQKIVKSNLFKADTLIRIK